MGKKTLMRKAEQLNGQRNQLSSHCNSGAKATFALMANPL
jgi:hypothetical protein